MLCESNLPTSFWVEAVNTANCVLNCYLIRLILKKTPYELFKGKKLNISYFSAFGCKYFILNNGKDRLGKFDARSEEVILVSYSMHSKTYRIHSKRTRSIEVSIHIVFYESNDGNISSSPFEELKLNRDDDDDEEEKEVRVKTNKEHQEILTNPHPNNNLPPSNDELHTTNEEEP